jgi:SAM-dependent methyltransferase
MFVEQPVFEEYERVYYGYQTQGRGLLSAEQLGVAFEQQSQTYAELFGNLLPPDKSILCLDYGCGYGNFLYFLRQQGYHHCVGIDSDARQVELARSLTLEARVGNVLTEVESFTHVGLIAAFDLIEHLDKNSAVYFLKSALASLSSGGMMVIQCPCADGLNGSHDIYNDYTHKWGASSNMLSQLLYTVGFERVIVLDPSLPGFPNSIQRKIFLALRRSARKISGVFLRLLGVKIPPIWGSSQVALAWKR